MSRGAALLLACVVVANVEGQTQEDARVATARTMAFNGADRSVTNRMAQAVEQLKSHGRTTRLKGASDLFLCSLLDPARMKREKVGDKIVAAYAQEDAVESKMAMLATLDLLGHPALTNMLADIEHDGDPLVRNLAVLIKEKRYLEPVVNRTPNFPEHSQKRE